MKRSPRTSSSELTRAALSGTAGYANATASALDELLEYIGCQVDPELRVLAMKVEDTMKERFKCGHVKAIGNLYPRCRICQLSSAQRK